MRYSRILLVGIAVAVLVRPAPAGLFFKKKAPPNPAERVPELIVTVKTEQDEKKRAAAAAELRQYDTKAYTDIVPILADVLQNDAKAAVRWEALQSLRSIRPIAPEAGLAVEHAASHDSNLRVRMQAKTTMMHFRLAGYHTPKNPEPLLKPIPVQTITAKTEEPPLAIMDEAPANPKNVTVMTPADHGLGRPLPAGPARSPLVPVEAPRLVSPPGAVDQGPDLKPPF